jgi:bifunctional non-homologous end joining protein LigD
VARKDPGPQSRSHRIAVEGARPAKHPGFVEPELATLRAQPHANDRYVHEVKFDGYRIQAHLRAGYASLWTRGGLDWTKKFPTVATGVASLDATEAVIDGEIVSAEEDGIANFSALQHDIAKGRFDRMAFYAFDLLYLDGYDVRGAALLDRKALLKQLLDRSKDIAPILYSEHFDTDPRSLFKQACELGLEGIISKRKNAPYKSERTEDWIKVKCIQFGRYEVIGYKEGASSLYLGRREGDDFLYAGKAGTGYTNKMVVELYKLMKPIALKRSPLTKKATHKIDHWVEPKYWAEVEYRDITADGHLRHVTFRGLYASEKAKKPLVAKFR